MSLIKCPECGHQVSSKAPYCPGCGVPILNNVKRCPVCNELVLMDAEECPQCKAHFVVKKKSNHDYPEEGPVTGNEQVTEVISSKEEETSVVNSEPTENLNNIDEPASSAPTSKVDPTVSNKNSKSSPWWLLLLAIIVVIIGGFYYYEYQQHEATEEKDYERLQGCTEQANFQDFINRYPESRHIENVRARLNELQRIDEEWLQASRSLNLELLQQFVDKYPVSVHKAEALHKIDSMDWREADRKGTEAAYALYIGRHENGEYINQAYVARDEARRREAQARQDSIEAVQAAIRDSLAIAAEGAPAAQ